jgi:hypothetical protein
VVAVKKGGKKMTPDELEKVNLECDLMDLVNKYAWPHSAKIVKELLTYYNVSRKHERYPIHVVSKATSR